MCSVGNRLSVLVIEDLRGKGRSAKPRGRVASHGGRRESYAMRIPLTPAQKAQLQRNAKDQMRWVSSYVARLIVADLARG